MKKFLLTFSLTICVGLFTAFAQAPQGIRYQSQVFDDQGQIVASQTIAFEISILQGGASGSVAYTETHTVSTNENGITEFVIGEGTSTVGTFSEIDWSLGSYFVRTSIDLTGSSSFTVLSSSELLSVPYALYAESINPVVTGVGNDGDVFQLFNDDYTRLGAYTYSNDPFAIPFFGAYRARGTQDAPADVIDGDRITGLYGISYNNGAYKVNSAVELYAGTGTAAGSTPSYMIFGTTPSGSTTRSERMRIDQDGNVGIGTTAPGYTLDVNGTINATEILVDGSPISSGGTSPWATGSGTIYSTSNMVGIGTDAPTVSLEVVGDGTDTDVIKMVNNDYARFGAYTFSNDPYAIPFYGAYRARGTSAAPTDVVDGDRITGLYGISYNNGAYKVNSAVELYAGTGTAAGSTPSYMIFGTTASESTSRTERMRIDQDGNVGIGTTSPGAKVTVADGDVYIQDVNSGVIMVSPNGTCWRMQVNDSGSPTFTSITCP